MPREIKLWIDGEAAQARFEENRANMLQAIAYLATWGLNSERYLRCLVFVEDGGNLNATFSDKDGNTTFYIHAQKAAGPQGTYSYHS